MPQTAPHAAAEWNPGWPNWGDGGKRVLIENDDGTQVAGVLEIEDYGFDGEDEYPIFIVRTADGGEASFALAEHWRFA